MRSRTKCIITFIFISIILKFSFSDIPNIVWLQTAEGEQKRYSNDITIDHENNIVICGTYYKNISFGDTAFEGASRHNVFMAKYNGMGEFQWAEQITGGSFQYAFRIDTDEKGNIFLLGIFEGRSSFGDTLIESSDNVCSFISKYSSDGEHLWTRSDSSQDDSYAYGLSVDREGDCYVGINFSDTTNVDSLILYSNGEHDFYIAKYNGSNGSLRNLSQYGEINNETIAAITLDKEGNILATGTFENECQFGDFNLLSKGEEDIFIFKINKNNEIEWAKKGGGKEKEYITNITCDSLNNFLITGSIRDTAYFDTFSVVSKGEEDIFLAKYDNNGNILWIRAAGGDAADIGSDVAILNDNSIMITGSFENNAQFSDTLLSSLGMNDIFWAKYENNGDLEWAKKAGGGYWDKGQGVAIDRNQDCIGTGYCYMYAVFDDDTVASLLGYSVFVTKLNLQPPTFIENVNILPTECVILGNYPNPFNPSTNIVFELAKNEKLDLSIYDISGRIIKKFSRSAYPVGRHQILWNGKNNSGQIVSSGIYFFSLRNDKYSLSKKLLLVK